MRGTTVKWGLLCQCTLAALLASCETVPAIDPIAVPPPASVCSEVEAEPQAPDLTPEQRRAVDVATIQAVGAGVAVALIRYRDVSHPAWGRRQAERIRSAQQALCEAER